MSYRSTWQANVVFPALIILGGIGFSVLYNMARLVRYNLLGADRSPLAKRRVMLQSKLAITTTAALLLGGMALIVVFELRPAGRAAWVPTALPPPEATPVAPAAPGGASAVDPAALRSPLGDAWSDRLLGAWFLSTTARTAGFNTVDVARLSLPTKFLTSALMFIGASPGSTGGGIKTVTLAVILCGVWAALRGKESAQAFRRTLPHATVVRAMAILSVCIGWVVGMTAVMAAWGMQDGARYTLLDCLFETTSAFATVGLSTGATPLLNSLGRLLIVMTMFVGRIGPLTLFVAMQGKWVRPQYSYPSENVAIS